MAIVLLFVPGFVCVAAPGAVHAWMDRALAANSRPAPTSAPLDENTRTYVEATENLMSSYRERTARFEQGLIVLAGLLYLGVTTRWLLGRAGIKQQRERETTFGLHLRTLLDGVQALESTSNPDELAPRMEVLAAARRRAELDWHAGLLSHDDIARLFSIFQAGGWTATQRMTRLYFYELQNQGDQLLAAAHPRYGDGDREEAVATGPSERPGDFFSQPFTAHPSDSGGVPEEAPTPEPEVEAEPPPKPIPPRPWYLDDAPVLNEPSEPVQPTPPTEKPRVGVVEYTYSEDEQWDTEDNPQLSEGIIGRPIVRRRTADVDAPALRVEHEPARTRHPEPTELESSQAVPEDENEEPTPAEEAPAPADTASQTKQTPGRRAGGERRPKRRGGKKAVARPPRGDNTNPGPKPLQKMKPKSPEDGEHSGQMDLGF